MVHIDCFVSSLVNRVIERSINTVQRLIFFNPFCLSATTVTSMWISSGLHSSSFWETDMHWPVEHFVIVPTIAALCASYTYWLLWHHCKLAVSLMVSERWNCFTERLAPFYFFVLGWWRWLGGEGTGLIWSASFCLGCWLCQRTKWCH